MNGTGISVLFSSLTLNSGQSTAGYGWTHWLQDGGVWHFKYCTGLSCHIFIKSYSRTLQANVKIQHGSESYPPWFSPYLTDHPLILTHTYWTNMCVFNSRNESHIIQICIRLLKAYLLWLHILLSFEYSELLLRSERITWTCSSLFYCCHTQPALKEWQEWCSPKLNYLLGLGANYILEIAECRKFLVLKSL